MLFSVPVGEQLIPYLQEIAADGSVALLQLTGVPLYRSGLYIEIPQGRFLVAEACSGVSFFIASFVIGSLYAYLNLVSTKRRVAFVAISLIFPVLANIVRVYGIILIAYWTDMEHAAGADHLIYGWFFFAFVIVCLLGIGELIRDASVQPQTESPVTCSKYYVSLPVLLCVILSFSSGYLWLYFVDGRLVSLEPESMTIDIHLQECKEPGFNISPIFNNPNLVWKRSFVSKNGCSVSLHEAYFNGVDNELISDLNRIYDPENWSMIYGKREEVFINKLGIPLEVRYLSSADGKTIKFVYWFSIGERHFNSKVHTKLFEIKEALKGNRNGGVISVLVSSDQNDFQSLTNRITGSN